MTRTAFPLAVALLFIALNGCKSSQQEDLTTNGLSQWTTVSGDVAKVTDASKAVLKDYNLKDIDAHATTVDGMATGSKADGTVITVTIKKASAGSQVTVQVGKLGDPKLGAEIAKKIKDKAEAA